MEILEITGTLVGLLYLWLEYRASIYLWVAGIVMPAIYIFVYYEAGLYADFGINIYYLLAALYGWCAWKYGRKRGGETRELPISHTPLRVWLGLGVAFLAAFAAIAVVLLRFTDSDVPYWDSLVTALSIAGMWQLARKYIEQWFTWILTDFLCAWLYAYKGLPFTAALYALYTVIAVFGYFKWLRLMHAQNVSPHIPLKS